MTPTGRIDSQQFLQRVKPVLERGDLPELLAMLRAAWTPEQITELLRGDDADARKVAALALGLVGGRCCIPSLAEQLKHPDAIVNQMAEHALWSIWFRLSSAEANEQLARGSQALNQREYQHAMEHFNRAIELDSSFAEAYNQRALAGYLMEDYSSCIADCREAVRYMPCHFGAWAGMGHSHAHLGDLPAALSSYQKALEINPHLECLREAVAELKRRCPGCGRE